MKKFYFLLVALFSFVGTTTAMAQDEETKTIAINANSGDYVSWNGNASNPWAGSWASSSDPEVSFHAQLNGSAWTNNVGPYDGTNFRFYNCIGGSGTSHNYTFSVASGWTFQSASVDFFASNADSEVYVEIAGLQSEVCNSTSKDDAVHFENEDINAREFLFTVGANVAGRFAHTFNFEVTVRRLSAYETAMDELIAVADEYAQYGPDGSSPFNAGTEPGDYDADAVAAFNQAIENAYGSEGKELTVEEIVALKDAILEAYAAVVATKVPYEVADGYYRIHTGLQYTEGDKLMLGIEYNTYNYAIWASPEDGDATDAIASLWQISKNGAGYDAVCALFPTLHFAPVTVSSLSSSSNTVPRLLEDGAGELLFEPAATIDGTTYFTIRSAGDVERSGSYFHQNGHSSGAGSSGLVIVWNPTYTSAGPGASEWYLEPVSDAEVEEILAAYEPIRLQKELTAAYNELKETASQELENAKELQYTALITEVDQLSSPYTSTAEGSLAALIDNSSSTYWHSDYSVHPGLHVHYLQVALHEGGLGELQLSMTRRNDASNDHITQWGVFGSNDPEAADDEWVELASLDMPYANNTETKTANFDSQGYQYLRFYIDRTTGAETRGFGHCSEFQLYQIVVPETSQYAIIGEPAKALDDLLKEQASINPDEVTQAEFDTLKDAYDAFKAQFVDPAELRELIAKAEGIANGVVISSDPGAWTDGSLAAQLKQTVEEAKAYDDAKVYKLSTSQDFIDRLTAQLDGMIEAANKIQEGKWYRIHFGSKDVFEANGWDVATNEPTESNGIQTNEALWDKYLTAAYLDEVTETTTDDEGEEVTVTINNVLPLEYDEDLVRGIRLFFDDDADISRRDLSLFRFINVGDSAYVLQNKATGLFVRGENTTLDVIPSVFNVTPLGYGQNLIAAQNLISGASQNNLHAQRVQNRLVTWSENTAGSRSGLYIEEVEDVASDYDGTEFQINLVPGTVSTFCFPVNILVGDVAVYDVAAVEDNVVKLAEIKDEVAPGRPFVYINGETEYYNEENAAEPVALRHGYDFTHDAIEASLLKGTYSTIASLPKGALAAQGNTFVVSKSATMSMIPVPAYTAYVQGSEEFELRDDYTFEITELEDGIAATLSLVAKRSELYTVDGRLLSRSANLNDLKKFGRGVYILGGTKVVVK